MRSFAHLWQQDEFCDVDIVLTGPHDSSSTAEDGACKLATFPGHSVLLGDSPFFRAQLLRWQSKRQHDEDIAAAADQAAAVGTQKRGSTKKRGSTARGGKQKQQEAQQQQQAAEAASANAAAGSSNRRPQLVLTLEHADQQPAALVVLEALYATKPLPELLSGLQQEQQLQAIVLADMWQVPDVGTAAANLLAGAADGLNTAVTERLMFMQAWPECLHVVAKRALLSVYGNLEAVWADGALEQQLLDLPLHAMALLMSCDELKVASEDTVLYTLRRYCEQSHESTASQQLTPLLRCPQLSLYWLAALASSRCAYLWPFKTVLPELSTLLTTRITMPDYQLTADDLQRKFAGAPSSWALPRRALHPVNSVQLTWQLSISDLLAAVSCSFEDNRTKRLQAADGTPPLSGFHFTIQLECVVRDGSCEVGLFAVPLLLPTDLSVAFKFRVYIPNTDLDKTIDQPQLNTRESNWGWRNFFGMPAKAEGWDAEWWQAKGLPTSGTLPITLTVYQLSQHHTAPSIAPDDPFAPGPRRVGRGGRGRGRGRRVVVM